MLFNIAPFLRGNRLCLFQLHLITKTGTFYKPFINRTKSCFNVEEKKRVLISANRFFLLQETYFEGLVMGGRWDGVNPLFIHITNVRICQFHIYCIWNNLQRNAKFSKLWWQPLLFPFTRPVLLPGSILLFKMTTFRICTSCCTKNCFRPIWGFCNIEIW